MPTTSSDSPRRPSRRYEELLGLYRKLHAEGEPGQAIPPERTFPGKSLLPHAKTLGGLFHGLGVDSVLDYGAGKGQQYQRQVRDPESGREHAGVAAYWGVKVTCFDPAYPPHAARPAGRFDAVICTDVLEHCPEEDIDWILDDLFRHARKLVYANVACFPALKHLPNGENAHITVRPADWWRQRFEQAASAYPGVAYLVLATTREGDRDGRPEFQRDHFGRGIEGPAISDTGLEFVKHRPLWKRIYLGAKRRLIPANGR